MKILRTLLVISLIVAVGLTFRAQRQGSGAGAAQIAYLVALLLLIADRIAAVRADRVANGKAILQVGVGALIAALLFSPDFSRAGDTNAGGLAIADVVAAAMDGDDTQRALALETCIRRRAFTACRPAFERAQQSDKPMLKALGDHGMGGRSRWKR